MEKTAKLSLIVFTCFVLQGCNGQMNKQSGGTLIGCGEGKLVATGVGVLAGALIGEHIGKTMDEYDRQMMEKSSRQALEFSPSVEITPFTYKLLNISLARFRW